MNLIKININADIGEGVGNESELMPYLSSCNIACGGHAGNVQLIRKVIELAKQYKVKIGAHPSFPDTQNFGRKVMNLSYHKLFSELKSQINKVLTIAHQMDVPMHHVKPHGALYNLASKNSATATVIVDVLKSFEIPIGLYALPNSELARIAIQEKIPVSFEAFIDRNYNDDFSLVSRKHPKALLTDEDEIITHTLRMVKQQQVKTLQGNLLTLKANTYCIHGDNPKIISILKKLKNTLQENHITLK